MDVTQPTLVVDQLTEQQGAPVAEPGDEAAELMPGVGLGDRGSAGGHQVSGQEPQPVGTAQPAGVEAKLGGQGFVERQQPQLGEGLGLPADRQFR
ncbi:hypothetical protein MOKP151_23540 [Mycobacterium avium subsp. hominissuis]